MKTRLLSLAVMFASLGLLTIRPEAQAQRITDTDPRGLYGNCFLSSDFYQSQQLTKSASVFEVGKTLNNVVGIAVIDCHRFDGGATGFTLRSCPPGSPFSYCMQTRNDGFGQDITLGVLELNSTTDPLAPYGGCADGAGYQSKLQVTRQVYDPRKVDGIVVTSCKAADGPPGIVQVPCTGERERVFSACFTNQDDGLGNHVELGVIGSFGSGDPYALYGGGRHPYGFVQGRFRSKSALVTEVGKTLDNVLEIQTLITREAFGPKGSHITPCTNVTQVPYSYCIENDDDDLGNAIYVGVLEGP